MIERRHVDQQCRGCDPVIVGIEMTAVLAAAVKIGEQPFDFHQHREKLSARV
jgi:hypothetical protein